MSSICFWYFSFSILFFCPPTHLDGGCPFLRAPNEGLPRPPVARARGHLPSPITFPHHNIISPKDGDDIGNQVAARHVVKGAHMDERRRANLHPVRAGAAVTDDKKPQFALWGLGGTIGLSLRWLDPLGIDDEMMD